jgi:hypothetical protein
VAHLAGVLADSSSTPDVSWYCVWSGYGGLDELEELAIAILTGCFAHRPPLRSFEWSSEIVETNGRVQLSAAPFSDP